MNPLVWSFNEEFGSWEADTPVKTFEGFKTWRIHAYPRPHYCDRGKWLVMVSTVINGISDYSSPLDDQEGFPRYFFELDNIKSEMQAWANERQEVRAAKGPDIVEY